MAVEMPLRLKGFQVAIGAKTVGSGLAEAVQTRVSRALTYKPFAGKPGSSPVNWVPIDCLVSRFANALHISDGDLKKRK